ncbi:flagellar hook-length control protein FliK [Stutzerimonas azotifigens]|uniref:Flagellar hook-length control protein FliK n=1 Tax=Stutzerimonas azotifigens TaxID=291995 RepID=A0ABR5YY11_9GAMM|nr:flagellar hook-length control protein FliK [Stutzerimonas azotifigens]MBA1272800.1 flagellar hook-length control protein FliK [Stutzerimonas azotifigens]
MSVSPDLLLKLTPPDLRAKALSQGQSAPVNNAGASTAPNTGKAASRSDAASFAQVFAQERQAKPAQPSKPAERSESTAAKPQRDKPADAKPKADSRDGAAAAPAEAPGAAPANVAASGNDLPSTETEQAPPQESDLDPLLMLGLSGQFQPALDPQATQQASQFGLGGLLSQAFDGAPEGEAGDSTLSLAGLSTEPAVDELALQKTLSAAVEGEAEPDVLQSFASALLGASQNAETESSVELDADLEELLGGAVSLKDSRALASESQDNRVNALTQPAAAQVQPHRPTLAPGQPVQMQQEGWSEAVVDRVMWLSSQNLKSAEIKLDPAELGRMEVRIEMNKDQTQVTFLSPHAGVRDALEGQLSRLRDMFAQQGMNLVDVNVSDQSRGWQGQGEGGGRNAGRTGSGSQEDETVLGVSEISSSRTSGDRGLVDYYA